MQYAQDPSGMAHAYGQQQQAATAASDGKEGAPGSGPPPVPPPASGGASAAGVAGPHPSQQAPHMQMHAAYAGLPPGMAPGAQYGHMYPTYPYAMPPNTGYHYMHRWGSPLCCHVSFPLLPSLYTLLCCLRSNPLRT